MTDTPEYTDKDGQTKPLTDFWRIESSSMNWLHMLHRMSAKHDHKGVVAMVNSQTGEVANVFFLDKSIYSADDMAGLLGKPVPEGTTVLKLKDRKEWADVVPPTVNYFGEA